MRHHTVPLIPLDADFSAAPFMLDLLAVDDERREQVAEWCRAHSIDPRRIPLETPLTATVIAEGRIRVEFIEYVLDENGRMVIDVDGQALKKQLAVAVVDDPPPGHDPVRSLTWDGHAWIRHLEETHDR